MSLGHFFNTVKWIQLQKSSGEEGLLVLALQAMFIPVLFFASIGAAVGGMYAMLAMTPTALFETYPLWSIIAVLFVAFYLFNFVFEFYKVFFSGVLFMVFYEKYAQGTQHFYGQLIATCKRIPTLLSWSFRSTFLAMLIEYVVEKFSSLTASEMEEKRTLRRTFAIPFMLIEGESASEAKKSATYLMQTTWGKKLRLAVSFALLRFAVCVGLGLGVLPFVSIPIFTIPAAFFIIWTLVWLYLQEMLFFTKLYIQATSPGRLDEAESMYLEHCLQAREPFDSSATPHHEETYEGLEFFEEPVTDSPSQT